MNNQFTDQLLNRTKAVAAHSTEIITTPARLRPSVHTTALVVLVCAMVLRGQTTASPLTVLRSGRVSPPAHGWDARFGIPNGLNGPASAVVADGADLYVGGEFTMAEEQVTGGLARWDGKRWHPMAQGIQGQVYALALHGKQLFAGGRFTVDGIPGAINVAKWNGKTWEALDGGIPQRLACDQLEVVYALAMEGRNLYVAGNFQHAGNINARNIALWDGKKWSALGEGIGFDCTTATSPPLPPTPLPPLPPTPLPPTPIQPVEAAVRAEGGGGGEDLQFELIDTPVSFGGIEKVFALAVKGKFVYAGGLFHKAGNVLATNVAVWDGRQWENLGNGVDVSPYGFVIVDQAGREHSLSGWVNALEFFKGELIVGGAFSIAGNVPVRSLARWTGSEWRDVPGGGVTRSGEPHLGIVTALAQDKGSLVVGGLFQTIGRVVASNIAKGDGRTWNALDAGVSDSIHAIASHKGDLIVTGDFGVAGNKQAAFVAQYNSHHNAGWSSLDQTRPTQALVGDITNIAADGDTAYVGGLLGSAGNMRVGNLVQWNGANWSDVGGGIRNGVVTRVAADAGKVYAAGSFTIPAARATNLACWDGVAWSSLQGGVKTVDGGFVYIADMATSGGILYVGGTFDFAGGVPAANLAAWNGNNWSALGGGVTHRLFDIRPGFVHRLAAEDNLLYVTGSFSHAGSIPAQNIAVWNGSTWSALGEGPAFADKLNWTPTAITVRNGALYLAAQTHRLPGRDYLAKWDGSSWTTILDSLTPLRIETLAATPHALFVGGGFEQIGGVAATGVAKWDGRQWYPLDGGVDFGVTSLAAGGRQIFVGGHFTQVNDTSSYRFAIWHESNCRFLIRVIPKKVGCSSR